jgi:outer membrane protein OmpA-like peptidoglycan-associated protein
MKRSGFVFIFLAFCTLFIFGQQNAQQSGHEEIDFLLFHPNRSDLFVNEERALSQLSTLANYLKARDLAHGQIVIYGYAADVVNHIDPVDLSRDRAHFVIGHLQRLGVPRELFSEPVAHGSVSLWGNNRNEEARSPNRRVRVLLDNSLTIEEILLADIEPEPEPETVFEVQPEPEIAVAVFDDDVIIEAAEESPIPVKEGPDFNWWILLPFLLIPLIPLLYYLAKRGGSKEKKEKTEKVIEKAPEAAQQAAAQQAVAAFTVPAPAPEAPKQAVQQAAEQPAMSELAPEPVTLTHEMYTQFAENTKSDLLMAASIKTGVSLVDLDEEIRVRAFEIFMERGCQHGYADADWYKAYPEVCARYEAKNYQTKLAEEDWRWKAHKTDIEIKTEIKKK